MGLLPAIRLASVNELGFAFVDRNGKHVAEMPVAAFDGEGIVAELEVLRGDLSRILYEATSDRVEYIFDDSIDDLVEDHNGVLVTFERAAARRFDMVIGADGVHSRVRALSFGDESAFLHPLGAYSAYFSSPETVATDGWFVIYNAPTGKAVGVRPNGSDGTQAMFNFLSPPLRYDRRDLTHQKQIVANQFADLGWEVPRLLAAMHPAPDFYFDLMAQVRMERWTTGRVALVGDAAYSPSPLTGLGTSLAIVASYVLAGELALEAGDYHTAFLRYESRLRDYVTQCQQLPPGGVTGMLPRSRAALWLRNQSMRMMTARPWRNLVTSMFHKADAIVLTEYAASGCKTEAARSGLTDVTPCAANRPKERVHV
jgi:2-polyprenyl-6-methoxyphenol hydroxylase-like FAD-dependent oxidoreductase